MKKLILGIFCCLSIMAGAEEKGYKIIEKKCEFLLNKGENREEKAQAIINNARIEAVSESNNIIPDGNNMESIQLKEFINSRAKAFVLKEINTGWEVEERENGSIYYKTKLDFLIKDGNKKASKIKSQNLLIDKTEYNSGDYQKVKFFSAFDGYYTFFIMYDDLTLRVVEAPDNNKLREIKSGQGGEWEMIYLSKPKGTGDTQILYAVVTDKPLNFIKNIPQGKMNIKDAVTELLKYNILSEGTVEFKVYSK